MRHSTLLTEFTDISQRLEYLVAHSSQLVFVTGEDAAVQQGFVEAFLGQQSNSANVAFLSAKRGKSNQYYRQQLAEQLFLKTSRNQSFVQAFAARDDKSQPVIIAITSAENIPEEVLRELWDLVLQNRFTRNGEQVNILMFGDHEWAEEVKSWLPTNNNDKPVLLTTQTLEYNEETEVEGDLDDLIANRRKLFQQRMQARALGEPAQQSLLHAWWFKLAIAAVFLLSFSSILIWQYFDVTQSALKEFSQFLFQQETTSESDAAQENKPAPADSADANQRIAANFDEALQSIEAVKTDDAATEAQQTAPQPVKVNTFSQQSADSPNSEYIADISAEQLKQLRDSGTISSPVTETDARVAAVNTLSTEQQIRQQAQQDSIRDALNELDALILESGTPVGTQQSNPEIASSAAQVASPVSGSDNSESINSTPQTELAIASSVRVPEEVATEQSFEVAGQPVPEQVGNSAVPEDNTGDEVNDFQVEDDLPADSTAATAPAEPVYQYHESILLELPNDSYVLQISGITTESLLEEFLVDNRLLNSVWVYKTQRYGGDWFVVLVNQSYDTLPQARSAVSLLSADLQAVEPFAKSVAAIRNEILQ